MAKHEKSGNHNEIKAETILVMITAVVKLIDTLIELIERLLK